MPMTIEQIRARKAELDEQAEKLKERLAIIGTKRRFLQQKCSHPKMQRGRDIDGSSSGYCPDCGYQY